jgi:hypothetical protein
MFDSDEITAIVILATNGKEIFAYSGQLVKSNLVEVTSGAKEIKPEEHAAMICWGK